MKINKMPKYQKFNEDLIRVDAWCSELDEDYSIDLLRALQKKITLPMLDNKKTEKKKIRMPSEINEPRKKISRYTQSCEQLSGKNTFFSHNKEGSLNLKNRQIKNHIEENKKMFNNFQRPHLNNPHLITQYPLLKPSQKQDKGQEIVDESLFTFHKQQEPESQINKVKSSINLMNREHKKKKISTKKRHSPKELEQVWRNNKQKINGLLTTNNKKAQETEIILKKQLNSEHKVVVSDFASHVASFDKNFKHLAQKKIDFSPYRIGLKERKAKISPIKQQKVFKKAPENSLPQNWLDRILQKTGKKIHVQKVMRKSEQSDFVDDHLQSLF